LKVVVATGQTGVVVDTRSGCFTNAVAGLPPPAFQIVSVVDPDLAHADFGGGKIGRGIGRTVPTETIKPLIAPTRIARLRAGRAGRPTGASPAASVVRSRTDPDFGAYGTQTLRFVTGIPDFGPLLGSALRDCYPLSVILLAS